jgi:hypothetical protein
VLTGCHLHFPAAIQPTMHRHGYITTRLISTTTALLLAIASAAEEHMPPPSTPPGFSPNSPEIQIQRAYADRRQHAV